MIVEELNALKELQKLDLENFELRKSLEDIPKNIEAMRQDVDMVGNILQKEKNRLEESEQWRLDREKEVALQNELLKKSKSKLQMARNEKENKAAQREIDTIRKNIQEREKEALEVMEAIEQYRAAIAEHTEEFAELEKHLKETELEGKAKIDDVEARVAQTASERKTLAARVPKKTLRLYDRIQKRKGLALVRAVDEKCTGCNMGILPQMFIELQRCDKLYTCPNCMRILYFEAAEADAEDE